MTPWKKYRSIIHVLACSSLFIFACNKDETSPTLENTYLGYFPLEPGFWIEYKADSVVHLNSDDIYNIDTAIERYSFYLREEIDESFYDAEGELAYRINRFRRNSDSVPWNFMNVWTAKVNSRSAQRVEDNIRFVKLSFPLAKRKTWDGNAYNFFPEELYELDMIHNSMAIANFSFDSTVTVIQNDFVSNINRIYKKEIYANHTGLIFKQLDSVGVVNLPSGQTVILSGIEYKLVLSDYKK